MSEQVQEIVLDAQGLRFRALAQGPATGDLVLLLHGFPQFADAWLPVMRELAEAGLRAVAVDQRGYSEGARPAETKAYALAHLTADVPAFADALGAARFHLVGHDWGGLVAWSVAAQQPRRLRSLTVLSTPHSDAFLHAVMTDPEQMWKSKYIAFFKMPGHVAEKFFLADGGCKLRAVYEGKVPAAQVEENVRRFSEPGALTAALDWYRALSLQTHIGAVRVPTTYIWGEEDMALGETAAVETHRFVEAPYRFERLAGHSHWLIEEAPERIAELILERVRGQAES